ncbi:response regulator [Helicobacter burdigaliensis]|uniref:response regulator n=1 Tax=Helicobacter burdigaliensis TaxID=2315334 RepID=UPI000EF65BB8|nr:response regulator [Helicobacter burdigaliensis]
MKILIIENEIYLAQSIAAKLQTCGFECEIISLLEDAMSYEDNVDIVLLSTSISGQNFYPVIDKFKNSIIILMIPYVSEDTVTRPLDAGAKDYILKPFMIEELLRKINHYKAFTQLQQEILFYKDYLASSFISSSHTINTKITFPFVIKSSSQRVIDACVVNYANHKKLPIHFISLHKKDSFCKKDFQKQQLTYIVGFEGLNKEAQLEFLKNLKNIPVILSVLGGDTSHLDNVFEINIKEINDNFPCEILSVDDYIKTMILKFEDKYPDTELSKRLGMSRKSLWEKRKKYGVSKKK